MKKMKMEVRADKVTIRKGDWVKIRDATSAGGRVKQGLVYNVSKTHISIKPARDDIKTQYRRRGCIIIDYTTRESIDKWWLLL
jgi:hypothetical protein